MDAQRALLDELMGSVRNLTEEKRRGFKEIKWDDKEVCGCFMIRFCPHDLFVNTRSDLGVCPKIHDRKLKESFEQSPRHDSYVPKFEVELAHLCENLVSDLDRRVRRGLERLAQDLELPPPPPISAEKAEQLSVLEEKIKNLLEQVDSLGEEGKVDEAEALMRKVELLNIEKTTLTQQSHQDKLLMVAQEKKMALCEICGSFLVANDAVERTQSHVTGKQHIGYGMVRDFLAEYKEAKEKAREAERVVREKEAEERKKKEYVQKTLRLIRRTYKGMNINTEKRFGHVPGIAIGDKFLYRSELKVVGMHHQAISGIDYLVLDGRKFAVSIVDAGRYDNISSKPGVLIYIGHGGQLSQSKPRDQKLVGGNEAMVNSYEEGYPIRVIKKCKITDMTLSKKGTFFVYEYDGLYTIRNYWQGRARNNNKLVFKFELHKISGQESISRPMIANVKCKGRCVVDDISEGEETMPIHAMNGIDSEIPPSFTYLNSVAYPEWSKKGQYRGCTCITGCSNSDSTIDCPCILRKKRSYALECGPNCKCPRSCMNRVSQRGLRYKLEIFMKGAGLWGVRSRSYIQAESFVCEYVGKLQRSRTGETSDHHQPAGKCTYEYMIDASKFGNVGRFINRAISPNLFVRNVFYDMMVPHLGLYAAKDILPNKELTLPMDDDIGEFKCRIRV